MKVLDMPLLTDLPEEGEHLVVWEEVDAGLGQERPVSFLIHLVHLHGRLRS